MCVQTYIKCFFNAEYFWNVFLLWRVWRFWLTKDVSRQTRQNNEDIILMACLAEAGKLIELCLDARLKSILREIWAALKQLVTVGSTCVNESLFFLLRNTQSPKNWCVDPETFERSCFNRKQQRMQQVPLSQMKINARYEILLFFSSLGLDLLATTALEDTDWYN